VLRRLPELLAQTATPVAEVLAAEEEAQLLRLQHLAQLAVQVALMAAEAEAEGAV
jgi:hypothetical protein